MLLPVTNHKSQEIIMGLFFEHQPPSRYDSKPPEGVAVRVLSREEFDVDETLVERHRQLFLAGFTRGREDELAWEDTMSSMSLIVLVEREGRLVGCGQANIVGPKASIENIVVAEDERGRGLGSYLFSRVLHESRKYARWAFLNTDPDEPETRLYHQHGFVNLGLIHIMPVSVSA